MASMGLAVGWTLFWSLAGGLLAAAVTTHLAGRGLSAEDHVTDETLHHRHADSAKGILDTINHAGAEAFKIAVGAIPMLVLALVFVLAMRQSGAIGLLGGAMLANMSRTPDILADAAYAILSRPSGECTGNLFIDEQVLAQEGHEPLSDVLTVLGGAMMRLSAVTGAQTDRMTRDDGWRLLSVGRQIERLDMLSHALGLCFERGLAGLDDGFALMLGLFESTITYRANFQARREVLPLVHLLVLDTDNPRSLAWVARTMRDRLRKLARHDPIWAESAAERLPQPGSWSLETLAGADETGRNVALIAALSSCSDAALALSNEISQHLFSHVGSADRAVWQ